MKPKHFIDHLDSARIVAAIKAIEQSTSGEIRVFVSHKSVVDPIVAARQAFQKLGVHKTRHRNGILIFVAPKAKKFAVLGDTAIHDKCGTEFWQLVSQTLFTHFRQAQYTDGIITAIQTLAQPLTQYFPRSPQDLKAQPDRIDHD